MDGNDFDSRRRKREAEKQIDQNYRDAIHFMSHELKNSVSVIAGFATRLIRNEEDPDRLKQLKIILDQSRFLEMVSSRFLVPSQLENGLLQIQKDRIEDLLEEVVRPVMHFMKKDSCTFWSETQERFKAVRPVKVIGDRELLRVVFHNLLANAFKYRSLDGELALHVGEVADVYRFSVWNEGPGVQSHETELIFDKFYRANDGREQNRKGSGLGLHNVRRILEAHGGSIRCKSNPGKCIEFVFQLPKQ